MTRPRDSRPSRVRIVIASMFAREGHFSMMGEAAWCSGNLLGLRGETRKSLSSAPLHASSITRAGHYSLSSLSFLTCKKDNYPLPHQLW